MYGNNQFLVQLCAAASWLSEALHIRSSWKAEASEQLAPAARAEGTGWSTERSAAPLRDIKPLEILIEKGRPRSAAPTAIQSVVVLLLVLRFLINFRREFVHGFEYRLRVFV